jgi:hypothetical protein
VNSSPVNVGMRVPSCKAEQVESGTVSTTPVRACMSVIILEILKIYTRKLKIN